jgi:hypothetical protein
MTIFAILMPVPQPRLADKIKQAYPSDHFSITETQWLVSSSESVLEVTAKLEIADKTKPTAPASGNAIVFAISSYFGRASTLVWDWIKSKLESPSHG